METKVNEVRIEKRRWMMLAWLVDRKGLEKVNKKKT